MTQEDKKLLLKDLSARLPYGVKIYFGGIPKLLTSITIKNGYIEILVEGEYCKAAYCDSTYTYNNTEYLQEGITEKCKPYLRPMSSMTKEEKETYYSLCFEEEREEYEFGDWINRVHYHDTIDSIDYLNSIHIDYRDLIPKGLAIKVTKENNPYK